MSLTSLLSIGVSGLDGASSDMEVVGNNIANADTIGFKESRADFADQISQDLIGAGQVGLGTELQMSQKIMDQGSLVTTGNATDLALQGNGFFVVQGTANGTTGQYYTRDGQLTIDQNGNLVTQGGLDVQGYQANATGVLAGTLSDLDVGNASSQPNPTANITLQGNLNSDDTTPVGAWDATSTTTANATSNFQENVTIYDSLGTAHQVTVYFRDDGGGAWEWHALTDGGGVTGGTAGTPSQIAQGTMNFNATGALTAETQTSTFDPLNATNPQALNFNFGTPTGTGGTGLDGLTQFSGPAGEGGDITTTNQDGYASGTLSSISVNASGIVTGSFTNGQTRTMAQVAVASFAAPDQLQDDGGNLYTETAPSGQPTIGAASSGGRASITAGALEQSNVDLSGQLVEMISAERNFQADSRSVSTADSVLQDLMSINANNT
jgi:flagellar hook protein FlgE